MCEYDVRNLSIELGTQTGKNITKSVHLLRKDCKKGFRGSFVILIKYQNAKISTRNAFTRST